MEISEQDIGQLALDLTDSALKLTNNIISKSDLSEKDAQELVIKLLAGSLVLTLGIEGRNAKGLAIFSELVLKILKESAFQLDINTDNIFNNQKLMH